MSNAKQLFSIYETMERIVEELNNAYTTHEYKQKGKIQFHFYHKNSIHHCYIETTLKEIILHSEITEDPTITISCSFYNWLRLAQKKLNPFIGIITGKLKFKGSIKFLKVLPEPLATFQISDKKDSYTSFEKDPSRHWEKPQNVLIINGSPRGKRGYTTLVTQSFKEGVSLAGATIEEIFLNETKVTSCKGCWHCWLKDTGKCILKDDFNAISKLEQEADMIIFAFPLYVDGMPGMLKNYFDRSVTLNYPYMENDASKIRHPRRYKKKQSFAVISICGFLDLANFDALSMHLKAISINQHRPLVAEIYRPAIMYLFNNPLHYFEQRMFLNSVKEAGIELITQGKLNRKTKKIISSKLSNRKKFVTLSNEFWSTKVKDKASDY